MSAVPAARRSSLVSLTLLTGLATASLLAVGCGGASSSSSAEMEPPPEGVEVLDAMRLEGPFRDLSEFCQLLGADTCDDTTAVELPPGDGTVTTGDGQTLRLMPVVTAEGNMTRTWLMFERNGELWALPPAYEHPSDSPLQPTVTVSALHHDAGTWTPELVRVDWNVAFRADGSDTVTQRFDVSELCLVAADEPLACAHVTTAAAVEGEGREAAVELAVVDRDQIVVTTLDMSDLELGARMPLEGRYQLRRAR